ncbi:hypothetical protein FACS1894216_22730 [Synergistales bacterium]|nr:hypothetical protein FACS1894216_22730 [Synergistales bacterium]
MDFDAFGCKDHVKCDSGSKIIADFSVTDASARGSQEFVSMEVRVKGPK